VIVTLKCKRLTSPFVAWPCIRYVILTSPFYPVSELSTGSVPFLLREHLSYSQIGTFALSSYPYSLKLLWSPIVDAVFIPSIGRRKSWIIPMQIIIGTLMLYISLNVQKLLDDVGSSSVITYQD
jgi:PAT family acetyl-CoA transporter-like MFS transporter 1